MSRTGSLASAALTASLTVLSASNSWGQSVCETFGTGTPTLRIARDTTTSGFLYKELPQAYNAATGVTLQVCAHQLLTIAQEAIAQAPTTPYDFFFGGHKDYADMLHSQITTSSEPFLYAKSIPILVGFSHNSANDTQYSLVTVGDLISGLPNPSAHSAVVTGTNLSGLTLVTSNEGASPARRNYAQTVLNNQATAPYPQTTPFGLVTKQIYTGFSNGITYTSDTAVPSPLTNGGRHSSNVYDALYNGQNRAGILGKDFLYLQGVPAPNGYCSAVGCQTYEDGPYVEFPDFAVNLYAIQLTQTPAANAFKQYFDTSLANGSWNARLTQFQFGTIPVPQPPAVPVGPYTAPLTAALLMVLGYFFLRNQSGLRLA